MTNTTALEAERDRLSATLAERDRRIARLERHLSVALCKAATLEERHAAATEQAHQWQGIAVRQSAQLAGLPGVKAPCGHPAECEFVTGDGEHLCGWCVAEAAARAAGEKAGEARWLEMARDAYAGNEQLLALHFALFREPPPAGQVVTVDWLAAKARGTWLAALAPCEADE